MIVRRKPYPNFFTSRLQQRFALLDQPPAPVPSPHPCDQVYLTPSMVERVMCAVLKQVCGFFGVAGLSWS